MRPYLRVANVFEDRIDTSDVMEMNFTPEEFETYRLEPGDILLNEGQSLELVGRPAVYRGEIPGACFQNTLVRYRVSPALRHAFARYIFRHYLHSGVFQRIATRTVNIAHLGAGRFARLHLPLPPLAEQDRIVAEIEKLLTRLDAAVTALKRAQVNLKRYRAAVLKAACEGRLVLTEAALARDEGRDYEPADRLLARIVHERRARWEAEQLAGMKAKGKAPKGDRLKARYPQPAEPSSSYLPRLPEGWTLATLDQLSWDSSYGTSEKCDYNAEGPPVLRIPNIVRGGIVLTDLKHAKEGGSLDPREALKPGDFLVIRTNGSRDLIGRAGLVRQALDEPHHYASYLIRFRLMDSGGVPAWVSTVWHSPNLRDRIERLAATSAGQYNISLSTLNALALPIPPLDEQHRIVAEVERRLSLLDDLDATVAANLKRAERLRQTILKRAFEGKLVHQDPADEPASALLESLRGESSNASESKGPPARSSRRGHVHQPDLFD